LSWAGGSFGGVAECVLAPNASPMTLDGTNTWVLAEPGSAASVVVDPGPSEPAHLEAVLARATEGGRAVAVVLLTHWHPDHTQGAKAFAAMADAPVRAVDPVYRVGAANGIGQGLTDGDSLDVGGLRLRVLATPGHTQDSVSFLLPDEGAVLTGDTVLGRGTTMIYHPDGQLGPYLDSLRALRRLAGDGTVTRVLPGHGPALADAPGALDFYLAHRQERLAQVEAAVAAGARTAPEVVAVVYADVDRVLWPAAEMSVRAQLEYLGVGG
jgi:glyoxylase-like metal-dependent hydrolase (beta-lactamase superfamily II)